MTAELELLRGALLDSLKHEGPRITDHPGLEQLLSDVIRARAGAHDDHDALGVGGIDRLADVGPERASHDVGDERNLKCGGIAGGDIDDAVDDERPDEEVQPGDDDATDHRGEEREAQEAAGAAGPALAILPALPHRTAPVVDLIRIWRDVVVPTLIDDHAPGLASSGRTVGGARLPTVVHGHVGLRSGLSFIVASRSSCRISAAASLSTRAR